jgi:hypothetical protein
MLGGHIATGCLNCLSPPEGDFAMLSVWDLLVTMLKDPASAGQVHWTGVKLHGNLKEQLPAYSPDFNPIERLWLRLKADWFWDFIARPPEELTQRLCTALKSFIDDSSKTASICAIRK